MERITILLFIGIVALGLSITTITTADSVQKTILELPFIEEADCEPTITLPSDLLISFNPADGVESYFNFTISQDYEDIIQGYYAGWCVEPAEQMTRNLDHTGEAYSSYDFENMPEFFLYGNERNSEEHQLIWKKINYLLNNIKNETHPIYDACPTNKAELRKDIQDVIWNITTDKSGDELSSCALHIIEHLNNISNNVSLYCPQQYIVILINTHEDQDPDPDPDPDPNPGGGGGNSGGGGYVGNRPPTADGSKNTPFTAVVGEPLTFDGSRSYDYDGTIIEWNWSMGDGSYHLGEIITHTYSHHGTYIVNLHVTDNDRSTDSYQTTAVIVQPNRPPTAPIITGTFICSEKTPYIYSFVSTDPDNDTISYTIDWGDGTDTSTTEYFANNTSATLNHIWEDAGIYTIKLFAKDNYETLSDNVDKTVYVNVNLFHITNDINGYFIDYGKDGNYERFHNNDTGKETTIEQNPDGWYLIDEDNDGSPEYRFHADHGFQAYSTPTNNDSIEEPLNINIIFTIVAVILCIIAIVFIYTRIR
jgi:hypothetical protein